MYRTAVILAGGLGTRLKPFTEIIPKPLLPVGESSVLELQILALKKHGLQRIFIATNYMADYVEAYVGDGSKWGINVIYSRETKPLGTCGPLSLLRHDLLEPFLLMNGDVLTTLDFTALYNFSMGIDADFVAVTKEIVSPFYFGKVISDGTHIINIEEKPRFVNEVIAGIYAFKPAALSMIPNDTYYGIDMLITGMLAQGKPIGRYLMHEYWLDIGHMEDYNLAQAAYTEHFKPLKGTENT
jgi:NDP-sugar pyrophosphorylase family protein